MTPPEPVNKGWRRIGIECYFSVMSRGKSLLLAVIVVLIAGCATLIFLLEPRPQSVLLKNGDRLTLEKVTFGTNHVFSDRPRALDQLFKMAPILGKWFKLPQRIWTTSSETNFCLWMSEFNLHSNAYVNPRWQAGQVVDEHGCILQDYHRGYNRGQGPKNVRAVLFSAWPRRQRQFTVNIFDRYYAEDLPIATFTVDNPWPAKQVAAINGSTIPTEVVAGPVTARLTRIRLQPHAPRPPYVYPYFDYYVKGKKSEDWWAPEITWSDSTGNQTADEGNVGLCLHEPVWRLKACIFKKPEAHFPPENVWSLPEIKLPSAGECAPLAFSTNLQGLKLSFLGIGGPGKVFYVDGVPVLATNGTRLGTSMSVRSGSIELECERHHLALDCSKLSKDQGLDLRYRQLPSGKAGGDIRMAFSSGTFQVYPFKVEPNTEAIEVEAIVQTGHRVEFSIKPPEK